MEEPPVSMQQPLRRRPRSREMEDLNVTALMTARDARSQRRKARGPAPGPPSHTATLDRRSLEIARERKVEEPVNGTMTRRPVRKAPVRPAPVRPASKAKTIAVMKPLPEATPPCEAIPSSAPQPTQRSETEALQQGETIQQQIHALERQKEALEHLQAQQQQKDQRANEAAPPEVEEEEEEVDFSGYEFHSSAPPKTQSPPSHSPSTSSPCTSSSSTPTPSRSTPSTASPQPSPLTPHNQHSVTARVEHKEGGGKRLIIKPSPGSTRKTNIVFNLPPPPPPPQLSQAEKGGEKGGEKEGEKEQEMERGKEEDTATQEKLAGAQEAEAVGEDGEEQKEPSAPEMTVTQPSPSSVDHTARVVEAAGEQSVLSNPNELSVLSNEYTNLDDSDNEVTTNFADMNSLEPLEWKGPATEQENELPSTQNGTGDLSLEHVGTTAIEEVSYDVSVDQVDADVDRSDFNDTGDSTDTSVQGYDIAGAEARESEEEDAEPREDEGEGDGGKGTVLPLAMEEHPNLALNGNGNNNTHFSNFPPPPLEFEAPAEKIPAPVPVQGVEMPREPVFDGEDLGTKEAENEGSGAIVLISMTTNREDAPIVVGEVGGVSEGVPGEGVPGEGGGDRKRMRPSGSESSIKSLGTQLSELDSMVTSMQEMVAEPSPTPPPSPLPLTSPASHSPPVTKSPLPPKPPPPIVLPSSKTAPAKPARPASKPVKQVSEPRKLVSKGVPDAAQSELMMKLAARQERLQASASTESVPVSPHQSFHSIPTPPSVVPAAVSVPQAPQTSGPHSGPVGDVQFQLQFLQQQFLQQQMMQLQQQFSHLQHSMLPPAPIAPTHPMLLPPSMYPPHMHTAQMVANPLGHAQFPGATPTYPSPFPPSPHTPGTLSSSAPSPLTSTPNSVTNPTSGAAAKPRPSRISTFDMRSGALGPLETQFDQLMVDMRETDPADILKKVSVCV